LPKLDPSMVDMDIEVGLKKIIYIQIWNKVPYRHGT
jgi:hypothetical protein